MGLNINTVTLSGNLTREAELKFTQGGTPILTFSLASNRSEKNGDGWKDCPQFFDIKKMGGGVDKIAQYMTKGRNVTIQGDLRQDHWEKDGQKRSKIYIWAEVINLGREPNRQQKSDHERFASDEDEMNRREASEEFQDDIPF